MRSDEAEPSFLPTGDYARGERFRVAFSDVDMNRHVNNLAYLRWAEHGRVTYATDVLGSEVSGDAGFILRKTEIVYERPMVYGERVFFGTRVARIGTRSMDFRHDCVSEDAGLVCAVATCTVVGFDYARSVSIPIPAAWIERILALERVPPLRP